MPYLIFFNFRISSQSLKASLRYKQCQLKLLKKRFIKNLFQRKNFKDLNFSLPPKYLDDASYLVNFELFYRNTRNLGIEKNNLRMMEF